MADVLEEGEWTTLGLKVDFKDFAEVSTMCDVQQVGETLVIRRMICTWEFHGLMTFSEKNEERLRQTLAQVFYSGRNSLIRKEG